MASKWQLSKADNAYVVQKVRMFRPFYGSNQRIKDYHEFQACVALHLHFICDGFYSKDSFLDAMVHIDEMADSQNCIILTE